MRWLVMLPLAAVGLLGIANQSPPITGIGACKLAPADVECWDMSGKVSETLTGWMKSKLADYPFGVKFRLGAKNRYLIVEAGQPAVSWSYVKVDNIMTFSSEHGSRSVLLVDGTDRKEASVTVTYQEPDNNAAIVMPYREHAKAKLGQVSIEFGTFNDTPPWYAQFPGFRSSTNRYWSFPIEVTGIARDTTLQIIAIDGKNRPIDFVDIEGKSAPAPIFPTSYVEGFVPTSTNASFTQYLRDLPHIVQITSNVDPNAVKELRIRFAPTKTFEIGGFLMEPRP